MAKKPFASSADLGVKTETLEILGDGIYALTAEGDPNVCAVEGEDFIELGTSVRVHRGRVHLIREVSRRVNLLDDGRSAHRGEHEDDGEGNLGHHFEQIAVKGVHDSQDETNHLKRA